MSDTVTKTPLDTLSITRNSTSVNFVSAEKKRGDKAGELYYAVDNSLSFKQLVDYIGEEDAKNMLFARVNILAQKWMQEASTDEAGNSKPFDVEEFKKYAQDFSARGLTTAQLQEEISRVTTEITTLATDVNFLAQGPEHMREVMTAKANRIKELQAAVAARKRKTTAEDSEA